MRKHYSHSTNDDVTVCWCVRVMCIIMLQVLPGTEPSMSSLGALQFAAVGLESVNYGHLQQHMQRQVLSALWLIINATTKQLSYLADDCRLIADARLCSTESRACVVTRTHSTFDDRAFTASDPGVCNSLPSRLKRCGLNIQLVPAVTKYIFVWTVGPRCSVNYFHCATYE